MRHAWAISMFALVGCAVSTSATDATEDPVTTTPETSVRNQKDTGDCWLFATTAWVESLEYSAAIDRGVASASDPTTRPGHLSVAYLDYWDWYEKITHGSVKSKRAQTIKDTLDSGGSWGAAVEVIARHGLARASVFSASRDEATLATSALDAITKSLTSGALRDPRARKDGAAVRRELDKAFGVSRAVSDAMTGAFGADGAATFGQSAASNEVVLDPHELEVVIPVRDAKRVRRPLSDAIGARAPGDDPDKRVGPYAWSVVSYEAKSPSETREYFRRIQRALHQDVPLPISWYFASNGDPDDVGRYASIPSDPADSADSGGHETLIDDYEVSDVPGFGTLKAGEPATREAEAAALADEARVVFLRVKNSWGTSGKHGRAGYDDLYFDYLTGQLRVCPKQNPRSPKCTTEIPLEDVTLPAGF